MTASTAVPAGEVLRQINHILVDGDLFKIETTLTDEVAGVLVVDKEVRIIRTIHIATEEILIADEETPIRTIRMETEKRLIADEETPTMKIPIEIEENRIVAEGLIKIKTGEESRQGQLHEEESLTLIKSNLTVAEGGLIKIEEVRLEEGEEEEDQEDPIKTLKIHIQTIEVIIEIIHPVEVQLMLWSTTSKHGLDWRPWPNLLSLKFQLK